MRLTPRSVEVIVERLREAAAGPKHRPRILVRPVSDWQPSPDRYLAAVTIVKNEAPYLPEWIEFHRLMGVEHFYFYDNASTDNTMAVLAPYLSAGTATLIPWGLPWRIGLTTCQELAFAHAISTYGERWRWMMFTDVDEFLFPTDASSLTEFLSAYEDLPAIAAFWTMFGTSGHRERPPGMVIENYTMRAPFPVGTKSKTIVNPREVVAVGIAHLFDLVEGPYRAYTEARTLFTLEVDKQGKRTPAGTPVSERLRLNHYYTRSQREFDRKLELWDPDGEKRRNGIVSLAERIERDAFSDAAILRFVPALGARLSESATSVSPAPLK